MRAVILCGGSGTRLHDYSLPKPLNYIHAKPAFSYVLEKIPFDEFDFIVAPHLVPYEFESFVRMHLKNKVCRFHYLPYFTRGPVESAWLGTLSFTTEGPIVFLDNDVVYTFPTTFAPTTAFLGYSVDRTGSEAFSFLRVEQDAVLEIQEKKRISDLFGCGVYGFASLEQFRFFARQILETPQTKELYMSMLFTEMLRQNVPVQGVYFESPMHIGSLQEVQQSLSKLPTPPLRICVDLDNTLVSSPTKPGDYSTVRPIPRMIELVQKWKAKGHTIILHTARRMQTHRHNVGAAIADCAVQTFQTLAEFQIPYDEVLFGKPNADIYVDDKAWNPYLSKPEAFGMFEAPTVEKPVNALATNKFNEVVLEKTTVLKRGPTKYLAGEIYYHLHIPEESAIRAFFPRIHSHVWGDTMSELRTDYIKGIPLTHLWQSQLLTRNHVDSLLEHLRILHNTVGHEPKPADALVQANYLQKMEERFALVADYPFSDAREIQEMCLRRLADYCESGAIQPVHFIHGDFWFSNILLSFQHTFQFIDMKGICWKTHTTGGDPMYDYAKLYQSFLGYDVILREEAYDDSDYHRSMREYYELQLGKQKISIQHLAAITFANVLATLPFIEDTASKTRVWNWAKKVFL